MRREHFKGVVWPKGRHPSGLYRYAIVGVLVTDEPIAEHEVQAFGAWTMVDGPAFGLSDAIAPIRQREATMNVGTANEVLTGLPYLLPDEPEDEPKPKRTRKKS